MEPLLDVRIPDQLGRQIEGYQWTGFGGTQLAVVLQAFDDPLAQASLAGICDLYVGAGVRLLAVEAADGPIRRTPGKTDIAQLIGSETVSAGVLSLLNAGRPVEVWGVDDVSLIPPSHHAMGQVSAARINRDRVFDEIRARLSAAQERLYPQELAGFRRARLGLYETRKPMLEQARLARAAAGRLGVELGGFPMVRRFLEIGDKENSQNAARAKAQQEEFVRRVLGKVNGWYKPAGGNRINIDLAKAAPVLAYWMEETGRSMEEFTTGFQQPNPEPLLLACKQWYDSWLSARALSGASHEFYELLMRLALRLEVPYFDLRDFRESVAQSRDVVALKVGLDDQLSELAEALVDAAHARSLGELEARFDLVHLMLQLAVPPKDAEARVAAITTVEDLLSELSALFRDAPLLRPAIPAAELCQVEQALEADKEFLRLSQLRSEHMVSRTLELIAERKEDRAVLAVGGFHARAISRAMDDYPQVSWAIIMPQVNVDAAWRQHRQRF
ncbi:MAG TPA: hypothetical protein VGQ69_14430 [Gemmatimonadales bacterium]|nr:hypothetical protein [Gemmatimonadales bacterium]